MRRAWMRRAGAFWQAFVHAQARSQLAPVPPRRSPAPIDDGPPAQVQRIQAPVPREIEPTDDR